jgi:hypothetical protein
MNPQKNMKRATQFYLLICTIAYHSCSLVFAQEKKPSESNKDDSKPEMASLAVGLDMSQWLLPGDDPDMFKIDARYRGSGGERLFLLCIYPESLAKFFSKAARDNAKAKESGDIEAAIIAPHYIPERFSRANAEEELGKVSAAISQGKIGYIPLFRGMATPEDPLLIKLPKGRYYFSYVVMLKGNNQLGGSALAWYGLPQGRPGEWGPLSVSVKPEAETKITVKPSAVTAFHDGGSAFDINGYAKFLLKNALTP